MIQSGDEVVLGPGHKAIPSRFWGRSAGEVAAERHQLSEFLTPTLTHDRAASDANVTIVLDWMREHGVALAPHGKTTMAPELWRRFLDAGAWGITVATPWQAQVALAAGIDRILIANEVTDPVGTALLAEAADAGSDVLCWVDSLEGVGLLAATAGREPIGVLVELGDSGGRTGARGLEAALAVARAVAAEPRLRLRGVAGYEASYAPLRDDATLARAREYLAGLAGLTERLDRESLFPQRPIVSAGGSSWFDIAAEVLGPLRASAEIVLRAGCVQAHDHAFYDHESPFAGTDRALHPALTVWTSVISAPEPGLAFLNAGKRDLGNDLAPPVPLDLPGATIGALNDQHAYLNLPPNVSVAVGDRIRLGIGHPCTTFDKWRLIPEIESADSPDPVVIGFIPTFF